MTPNEYQALAMRTKCDQSSAQTRFSNLAMVQLNHASLGLAGDAGELCNAVARCAYYGKELDVTNVKEEIGDCLWWLAEACDAIGVTMEEMMGANIRKLRTRYPVKYEDKLAAEEGRNREAERKAIEELKYNLQREIVHDPVVGNVVIEKQIEQQERTSDPPMTPIKVPMCHQEFQLTKEAIVESKIDIFGLPKQSRVEHLCPNCGAKIGKSMRELVNAWLSGKVTDIAPYPCHDCGQPLTNLRIATY